MEACLAEAGTLQLEFQYLSDVTGNPIYAKKALRAMDQLSAIPRGPLNLYGQNLYLDKLQYSRERFGIAGCTDSFYEYLLKLGLATGDEKYIDMYHEAADVYFHSFVVPETNAKKLGTGQECGCLVQRSTMGHHAGSWKRCH